MSDVDQCNSMHCILRLALCPMFERDRSGGLRKWASRRGQRDRRRDVLLCVYHVHPVMPACEWNCSDSFVLYQSRPSCRRGVKVRQTKSNAGTVRRTDVVGIWRGAVAV